MAESFSTTLEAFPTSFLKKCLQQLSVNCRPAFYLTGTLLHAVLLLEILRDFQNAFQKFYSGVSLVALEHVHSKPASLVERKIVEISK